MQPTPHDVIPTCTSSTTSGPPELITLTTTTRAYHGCFDVTNVGDLVIPPEMVKDFQKWHWLHQYYNMSAVTVDVDSKLCRVEDWEQESIS